MGVGENKDAVRVVTSQQEELAACHLATFHCKLCTKVDFELENRSLSRTFDGHLWIPQG